MLTKSPPATYRLRGRLLRVITVLVALVVVSGAATVLTGLGARRAILASHTLEVASRRAALLSVIAREQYIHEAHTIILRDRSHVAHHDQWVKKLADELADLRPDVDGDGAQRLAAIDQASRELKAVFADAILPAIDRQDWAEVRRAHAQANALVDQMTDQADLLATYFDARATHAEQGAGRLIRIAFLLAAALVAMAAVLAVLAARSLWRSFSMPLGALERVAERVTAGDRTARVEPVAAAELAPVAEAFNRMLDALARAQTELVAAERLAAIGRIAAGVAHEINNPIAIIRGYVKTMRREATAPALRDELAILDEEAAACQRIAEELLMYARSPAMEPANVDAAELLRDAAERSESGAIRKATGAEAPAVEVDAEAATILVDALRIRQVVINLVANAREATTGDEAVVVLGRRRGDDYRIEVLDRGTGLSEEARAHLFEPFFTTRRDGSGLGLAVCFGLITAHGGTIIAEPRPDGGSRLVVDLPGVVAQEGDHATKAQEKA